MYLIEVLFVSEKPLYVLRTDKGMPILSSYEFSEIQQKVAGDVLDFIQKQKSAQTNSKES